MRAAQQPWWRRVASVRQVPRWGVTVQRERARRRPARCWMSYAATGNSTQEMHYLDTSAFLKLLVREVHTAAMARSVEGADLWSSTLLAVEAHRAARRLGVPADEVDALLDEVSLILPAAPTFKAAQSVGSPELRVPDALHLASALEIGDELESLITYDKRFAAAASALGLIVSSPGLPRDWWKADL